MSEAKETRQFEAEVTQLLKLMIHSMYSNREVFLRELVSNASDAIDKLRFEALSDEDLFEGQTDLRIEIEIDADENALILRDTGIGMSRQEVAENIGTIAKSGTQQFLEKMTGDEKEDARLIGQFGVGFYSAFMVADRVVLKTRRAGADEGVRWESRGDGEYTLSATRREERGTEIKLFLREDAEDYLQASKLEGVIRRYSDHISFPIYLIDPAEEEEQRRKQVNEASALWTRPRAEIDDEEYVNFYKHVARAFDEPLTWIHSKVEGLLKFTLLFYLPTERPLELMGPDQRDVSGVKLYVKRVFILDDAEMFLPRYLRFIRGVVDSDDLSLNVSREILQDNRVVASMRKTATKRVLKMLGGLAEDPEEYRTFWESFGAIFKEGIVEDPGRQQEIAALLRFASTGVEGKGQTVSLDDYKERMKEGQEAIYYITADTFDAAVASPHLEIFEEKGVEVLVLTDTIDEWVVSHLREYEDVPLRSVDRGALELEQLGEEKSEVSESDEDRDQIPEKWKSVVESVKAKLEDSVRDVRLSRRLTESPACLVREEWEMGERMRRLLNQAGEAVPAGKPTLELNPDHQLVMRMQQMEDDEIGEWARLFFDQARLSEGAVLEAPAVFVRRLNKLMGELAQQ